MLALVGPLPEDVLLLLDALRETRHQSPFGPLRIGLLVGLVVALESVVACVGMDLPFLANLATLRSKPPKTNSLFLLM